MSVVLIGFMGSGKSTVGRLLAQSLGMTFLDTDELIEEVAGEPIDQIWQREGEEGFRDREQVVVGASCATPHAVISTGAGVVTRDANRRAIANVGTVAYLEAPADILWARASATPGRPNAADRSRFDTLYEQRRQTYESLATIRIGVADPVEQIVDLLRKEIDG